MLTDDTFNAVHHKITGIMAAHTAQAMRFLTPRGMQKMSRSINGSSSYTALFLSRNVTAAYVPESSMLRAAMYMTAKRPDSRMMRQSFLSFLKAASRWR